MSLTGRVGEVIEASSTAFRAQCYQLYEAPPLGSLVRTGDPEIYGVVCRIATEPLDPSRPVLARGETAVSEEQLYKENPQIEHLLTSRFEALIVGHRTGSAINQHLPPLPPRVHSFIYTCHREEVAEFSEAVDFLHTLVKGGAQATEEVIRASMLTVIESHAGHSDYRLKIGRALAQELSADLPQLNALLRGLAP